MTKMQAMILQEMGRQIDVKVSIYQNEDGSASISFRDNKTDDYALAFNHLAYIQSTELPAGKAVRS